MTAAFVGQAVIPQSVNEAIELSPTRSHTAGASARLRAMRVDFSDLDGCRALGNEERQALELIFGAGSSDESPDRVTAEAA